jgi:hypothetical protein
MKKRTNKFKLGWQKFTSIEENQLSLGIRAFFSGPVFLFATSGSEFQEQASLVEKESSPVKGKFEKWHQSKNKDFQALKSNARMKFESSVQLTNRFKIVEWGSYKKFKIPNSLAVYQGDGLPLLPNYPFSSSRSYPIC